ncbi:MAG: YqaJ viral recombinase family protein [Phenylobacterium sp.]|uniref:lambda exonuclease family protein n=1 Tax=Phenylobacterium sp. TaxID=1871053 RepID=UPI0027203715|nr:lambda exonuclease family protein [Phenylobacterium sp.]MDO8912336.1 YqaJ viral recombinase family protein [Phenylobacterium sp.]MDP3099548.1 YqaJ viral recombinase family protein [Phenylobacterium sp.]
MSGPIIHDAIEQGTEAWHQLRCGLPTSSKFSDIMAKGEGKTRRTYMLRLAGEIITGQPAETFKSAEMERGNAMEEDAREAYAFTQGQDVRQVGFIVNGPKGCSPDGLIDANGMVEFKTKKPELHIACLLKDEFPSEHRAQCQGALWVAEREWIDLGVYWPGLPLFVKRAYRDDNFIRDLAHAVDVFNVELHETVEKVRRYGQPEKAAA